MFFQPFPVLMNAGVLNPVTVELVVTDVLFREAAVAGNLMQFDFCAANGGDVSASWNPEDGTASVFGRVRQPDAAATAFSPLAVCVFGVALGTVGAAGTGSLRVIGEVDTLVKATSASTEAGACFVPVGGAHTVAVVAVATGTGRKIVAICRSDAGSATTALRAFFNGFGFGQDVTQA